MNELSTIIEIGSTRALHEIEPPDAQHVANVETLNSDYLTDVFISGRRLQFIVDTFPFLSRLISCLYDFDPTTLSFFLEIGEGLAVEGKPTSGEEGRALEIKIVNCGMVEARFQAARPAVLLFLAKLVSDLDKSITAFGLDVPRCLTKLAFSPR